MNSRDRATEAKAPSQAPHLRLGALGERLAAQHLRRDGMRILARNWRYGRTELDIVAAHAGTTIFCEVKTRRTLQFGTPMEAIDARKVDTLKALANAWSRTNQPVRSRRFDVIGVLLRGDGTATMEHRQGVL